VSMLEKPFPESELTAAQRQQIRELLVREAGRVTRRPPTRWRVAIPAAALAVGVAVAGATVVSRNWDRLSQGPAGQIEDGAECRYARHADPDQGKGVLYVAPVPTGWTFSAHLNQQRYCSLGTDPVAVFVKHDGSGLINAAVTFWRSWPPDTKDPEGRPIQDPDQVRVGTAASGPGDAESATPTAAAPAPITIRSRSGWRIRRDTLTWTESGGQRWSMTSLGLTVKQQLAIAETLSVKGAEMAWPGAATAGYQQLAIPSQAEPKERSWQPIWYSCYAQNKDGGCTLSVIARRVGPQGQTRLSGWSTGSRLVDVGGRPGILADDGDNPGQQWLETQAADGTLLSVAGMAPPGSTLMEFAAQLARVAPDDPRVQLARPRS